MKRVQQTGDEDCGVAAVAMLLDGRSRMTRKEAYQKAFEVLETKKRTRISQLASALERLGRPLRSGKMAPVPEGGLPTLQRDALVKVKFVRENSLHWMVWDHGRQQLLDPEEHESHFSEFHVLNQIEVAE
jgi:ABC-type bacteriocin/lantibiotic exporter with double-glycine peptidase domain